MDRAVRRAAADVLSSADPEIEFVIGGLISQPPDFVNGGASVGLIDRKTPARNETSCGGYSGIVAGRDRSKRCDALQAMPLFAVFSGR
jgi:hypothetical protein